MKRLQEIIGVLHTFLKTKILNNWHWWLSILPDCCFLGSFCSSLVFQRCKSQLPMGFATGRSPKFPARYSQKPARLLPPGSQALNSFFLFPIFGNPYFLGILIPSSSSLPWQSDITSEFPSLVSSSRKIPKFYRSFPHKKTLEKKKCETSTWTMKPSAYGHKAHSVGWFGKSTDDIIIPFQILSFPWEMDLHRFLMAPLWSPSHPNRIKSRLFISHIWFCLIKKREREGERISPPPASNSSFQNWRPEKSFSCSPSSPKLTWDDFTWSNSRHHKLKLGTATLLFLPGTNPPHFPDGNIRPRFSCTANGQKRAEKWVELLEPSLVSLLSYPTIHPKRSKGSRQQNSKAGNKRNSTSSFWDGI